MPERRRVGGGSRQPDLFARSNQPKISLPDNHPMVVLTGSGRAGPRYPRISRPAVATVATCRRPDPRFQPGRHWPRRR